MPENENKVIFTPKVEEEGRIDEFPTINPDELQVPQLATVPVDPQELEAEEIIMEGVEEELQGAVEENDLDKKNYVKITSTFYIQPIESEEEEKEGEDKVELFKILNPVTGVVEKRELTDEEKHEIHVVQLKESQVKFRPIKHAVKTVGTSTVVSSIGRERKVKDKEVQTNITVNQFGAAYRKKRQRRNKLAKASRKANR